MAPPIQPSPPGVTQRLTGRSRDQVADHDASDSSPALRRGTEEPLDRLWVDDRDPLDVDGDVHAVHRDDHVRTGALWRVRDSVAQRADRASERRSSL